MRVDRLQNSGLLPAFIDCQAGVLASADFKVAWVSTSRVDVPSGWALITDLANTYGAVNALVPTRASGTTQVSAIPAAGANPRVDQIILTLPTVVGGAPTVVRVAGIETAAATLDTAGARVADATLNSTYPQGWLRLADVLVGTGGVASAASVRDRRFNARGLKHQVIRSTTTGQTTTAVGDAAATSLCSGIFDFRMECNGSNVVEIGIDASVGSVPTSYFLLLRVDGANVREFELQGSIFNAVRLPYLPTAGTHLFTWHHFVGSASTAGLDIYTVGGGGRAYGWAREHVGGIGNNGVT